MSISQKTVNQSAVHEPLGEVVRWSYSSRLDRRGESEIVSDFRRHETERFFTIFVMSLGTIVVDGK